MPRWGGAEALVAVPMGRSVVPLPVDCGAETAAVLFIRHASRLSYMMLMSAKGGLAQAKCLGNKIANSAG